MLDEKDLEIITRLNSESEKRMMVMMESYFDPKFNLLSEKIDALEEKLAPKSRVEALEDEMAFMKTVISAMSKEIQELKKAQ